MSSKSIKQSFAKILDRLVDLYIGENPTMSIGLSWRVICAFAGAITPSAFAYIQKITIFDILSDFSLVKTFQNPIEGIATILIFTSPLQVALMIGFSLKKGGPLRFFLVGFFLYSFLLWVVVYQTPDLIPVSQNTEVISGIGLV